MCVREREREREREDREVMSLTLRYLVHNRSHSGTIVKMVRWKSYSNFLLYWGL